MLVSVLIPVVFQQVTGQFAPWTIREHQDGFSCRTIGLHNVLFRLLQGQSCPLFTQSGVSIWSSPDHCKSQIFLKCIISFCMALYIRNTFYACVYNYIVIGRPGAEIGLKVRLLYIREFDEKRNLHLLYPRSSIFATIATPLDKGKPR